MECNERMSNCQFELYFTLIKDTFSTIILHQIAVRLVPIPLAGKELLFPGNSLACE